MTSAFLVLGLLFPRLTLLYCWIFGAMPANGTPFAADVIGAIIAPRLLIGLWAHEDPAVHYIWPILYIVAFLTTVTSFRRENAPAWAEGS